MSGSADSGAGDVSGEASAAANDSVIRFKAGDVILTADPLVHMLEPKLKGKHCDNCYRQR